MNRLRAIGILANGYSRYVEEFCIGNEERSEAYREAAKAFDALGVTDTLLEKLGYEEFIDGS